MKDRSYFADLCNWAAVQSRFGIKMAQPGFVFTLAASRYGQYLALVIHSNDGHSFAAAAVTKGRDAPEEFLRPLKCSRWDDVAWKLGNISPVAAHHRRDIEAWIAHVCPASVPELVSIDGPDAQVLRLLRDALGLTGQNLKRAVSHSKLMQVAPAQFHALAHWAPRFPKVTISTEILDART